MLRGEKRAGGRGGAPLINQSKPGATVPRRMGRGDGSKGEKPKCWLRLCCEQTFTVKGPESLLRNPILRLSGWKKGTTSESMLFTRDSKHTQNA